MSIEFVKKAITEGLSDYAEILKKNKVMVAGGTFTSLFTKSDVNDIDCYFRSKKDLVSFIVDLKEQGGYPYFNNVTDKSMTLTCNGKPTIQLIYFEYLEDLNAVFNKFDFTISMCGYDFATDKLEHHPDFFSDLAQRRLSFNSETAFPLISGIRVNKFRDRGFNISRSEMMKVMLAVSKVKITTVEEFVTQVGGMYGNAALSLLTDDADFNLDEALKKLAVFEGENIADIILPKTPFPVTVTQQTDTMPLDEMARLLAASNPLSGGWYRSGPEKLSDDSTVFKRATYLNGSTNYAGNYVQSTLPLTIALLFAKKNERKAEKLEPVVGLYYKFVKKTDEPMVFSSFVDPKFKYRLGEPATSGLPGLFVCSSDKISGHNYRWKEDAALLVCVVNTAHIIPNENCSNYAVSGLTPIAYFTDLRNFDYNSLTASPSDPTMIRLDSSPEMGDVDLDEDTVELNELFPTKIVKSLARKVGSRLDI